MNKRSSKSIIAVITVMILMSLFTSCMMNEKKPEDNNPPTAVTNIYPVQSEMIEENSPLVQWTQSTDPKGGPVLYQVQFARDAERIDSAHIYECSGTEFQTPLLEAGIWYWQVSAVDNLGDKTKSGVWNFTVNDASLPQPTDLEEVPEDPALIVSEVENNAFTLKWPQYTDPQNPETVITYVISLYKGASNTQSRDLSPMINRETRNDAVQTIYTTDLSHTFVGLDSNALYEWLIIAQKNNHQKVLVGSSQVYTGNKPPSAPSIINPDDGSILTYTSLTMSWTPSTDPEGDAVKYYVYLNTVPHTYNIVSDPEGMTGNTFSTNELEKGRTYYWHIMAKDAHGAATRTESYHFTIQPDENMAVPTTPMPSDRAEELDPNNPPQLQWAYDSDRQVTFSVYFMDKFDHLTEVASGLTVKNYQIEKTLDYGKKYYWQIKARDTNTGLTTLSQLWTFKTTPHLPPEQISARTNAAGTQIELLYNEAMTNPEGNAGNYIIKKHKNNGIVSRSNPDSGERINIDKIEYKTGTENTYLLTLAGEILTGEHITIDYAPGTIGSQKGGYLVAYTDKPVENQALVLPKAESAKCTTDGETIQITFDREMADPTGKQTQFSVNITNDASGIVERSIQIPTAAKLNTDNPKIIELTLNTPIKYGDQIRLNYTAGDVQSQEGARLKDFQKDVSNTLMPVYLLSAQTNATGTIIQMTFDREMADPTGKHEQFKVDITAAEEEQSTREIITTTAAKLNTEDSHIIELTLNGTITYGEAITISYTEGDITGADDVPLNPFENRAVTNTVPNTVFVSAGTSGDGQTIAVTFNKDMADPTGNKEQFSVTIEREDNTQARDIQTPATIVLNENDPTIITLMMAQPVFYGDIITISYTPGTVKSADQVKLMAFENKSVTNGVSRPNFVSAETSLDGRTVKVTFDREMADPTGEPAAFSLTGTGGEESSARNVRIPTEATLNIEDAKIMELTFETAAKYRETLSLSYNPGTVKSALRAPLSSFTKNVVNRVPDKPVCTAAELTEEGTTLTLTFNMEMADPTGNDEQFTILVNKENQDHMIARPPQEEGQGICPIKQIRLSEDKRKIILEMATPVGLEATSVKVSYEQGTVTSIVGRALDAIDHMAVATSNLSTYWVSKNTPWSSSIKAIVENDRVVDGDVVIVNPGVYQENFTIQDKAITLKSTYETDPGATATTVIEGADNSKDIIKIIDTRGPVSSRDANNAVMTVEGLTLKRSGEAVNCANIYVSPANVIIRNNYIVETADHSAVGIVLAGGSEAEIYSNTLEDFSKAVYISSSTATAHDNLVKGNSLGIYVNTYVQTNIYDNDIQENIQGVLVNRSNNKLHIYENDVASNTDTGIYVAATGLPTIYKNTIRGNSAEKGGGIWVNNGATVYNKSGEEWKKFNMPGAVVTFVEHNTNPDDNNIYSNNRSTTIDDGDDVYFDGQVESASGTLVRSPVYAFPGLAGEPIEVVLTLTLASEMCEGTLTITLPDEASITSTDRASITINSQQRELAATEISEAGTAVNLVGLTSGSTQQEIILTYIYTPETDMATDIVYGYTSIFDADGSSTRYTPSEEATEVLRIAQAAQFTQGSVTGHGANIQNIMGYIDKTSSDPVTIKVGESIDFEEETWIKDVTGEVTVQASENVSPMFDGGGTSNMFIISESATVTFDGIGFANGFTDGVGGAIFANSPLILTDCSFASNTSENGGGAIFVRDSLKVVNCEFASNTALEDYNDGGGAAIFLDLDFPGSDDPDVPLLVEGSTFTGNSGYGAVRVTSDMNDYKGVAKIHNSYFASNTNAVYCTHANSCEIATSTFVYNKNAGISGGGAVMIVSCNEGSILDSLFSTNTSEKDGGAVYLNLVESDIAGCEFVANTSKEDGGAVYINFNRDYTSGIEACTLTFNESDSNGGAVFAARFDGAADPGSKFEISDSFFSTNTAAATGGALYYHYSDNVRDDVVDATITNSIFIYNQAGEGGGLSIDLYGNVEITSATITNNEATTHTGGGIRYVKYNNQTGVMTTARLLTEGNHWDTINPDEATNETYALNDNFSVSDVGVVGGAVTPGDPVIVMDNAAGDDGDNLFLSYRYHF